MKPLTLVEGPGCTFPRDFRDVRLSLILATLEGGSCRIENGTPNRAMASIVATLAEEYELGGRQRFLIREVMDVLPFAAAVLAYTVSLDDFSSHRLRYGPYGIWGRFDKGNGGTQQRCVSGRKPNSSLGPLLLLNSHFEAD